MEWPTSSSQPSREDTHPDSLSINPFLFPRSPAVAETYQASSIPANQLNWASTSVTGFPIGIEPHGWTVPPAGVSDGGGIPLQGGVAQAHSSYDEIRARTLAALYTSGGQPEVLANAHTNSALVAPNRVASRQSDKAPERYVWYSYSLAPERPYEYGTLTVL
ncbi:hypothetical protein N8T08_004705 [Aspergillus melleus]|uniref:Uncharacterized protein n=1 Tax=Aspergillus melleus TaxID=138277 RepID=A0ACC3B3J8_9EURO|nr:hypothetical protein N8T08_004705 [Aspergillus melleus]